MAKSKYWDVPPDRVNPEWLEKWWGKAQKWWPAYTPYEIYLGHVAYQRGYDNHAQDVWRDVGIPVASKGGFDEYVREHNLPYGTKPYEVTRPHFIKMVDASFSLQHEIYLIWDILQLVENNRHLLNKRKEPARILELA